MKAKYSWIAGYNIQLLWNGKISTQDLQGDEFKSMRKYGGEKGLNGLAHRN